MPPPLPPKHDPARPLHLAVRSTWLLGVASVGIGLVVIVLFGYLNRYQRFRPYFLGGGLLIWFIPGVAFVTCSYFIRRRSHVAAVLAFATAGGQALCAAALLYASLTLEPVSPIPVVLAGLWLAALVQLAYHLWRSLAAIRLDVEHHRGFDLAGPRPVLPAAATTEPPAPEDPHDVNRP